MPGPLQRKIVWADGKRLSIEQSTDRIHARYPGVPRHLIETTPNANSRNSTGSSGPGSTTMGASHEPQETSRELGTLETGKMTDEYLNRHEEVAPGSSGAVDHRPGWGQSRP